MSAPAVASGPYQSTSPARRFAKKNTYLSELYWATLLGSEVLAKACVGSPPEQRLLPAVGSSVESTMYSNTVGEFRAARKDYMRATRLHLLVICSAHLEAYLQDVMAVYRAAREADNSWKELSGEQKQLVNDVAGSSSVNKMVERSGELLSVSFGVHAERWEVAYQLRCAAAHNGGEVDPRLQAQFPELKLVVGERLGLEWGQLLEYLDSAGEIVRTVDRGVAASVGTVQRADAVLRLRYWAERTVLPEHCDAAQSALRDEGFAFSRTDWGELSREFYDYRGRALSK